MLSKTVVEILTEDGQESPRSATGRKGTEMRPENKRHSQGCHSFAIGRLGSNAFRKLKKAQRTLYRSDRSFHFQAGNEIRR